MRDALPGLLDDKPPIHNAGESLERVAEFSRLTANKFGGAWTTEKLSVLSKYLAFYTKALLAQPAPEKPFRLVYIDAFAGTGRCHVKTLEGSQATVPGSASIALATSPGFAWYHFVEPKAKHLRELHQLVAGHPLRDRISIHEGTAEDALPGILGAHDWRTHRGVLFLDPFGLQCSWPTLQQVQGTKALDVFFLLSVSGLFRQAAIDASGIDSAKAAALTRVFGEDAWRTEWYTREQQDMFADPLITRDRGWEQIVGYSTRRLRSLFPEVLEPRLLRNRTGPPLFALYLAVSNPSPTAISLARKAGKHVLSKLG